MEKTSSRVAVSRKTVVGEGRWSRLATVKKNKIVI